MSATAQAENWDPAIYAFEKTGGLLPGILNEQAQGPGAHVLRAAGKQARKTNPGQSTSWTDLLFPHGNGLAGGPSAHSGLGLRRAAADPTEATADLGKAAF